MFSFVFLVLGCERLSSSKLEPCRNGEYHDTHADFLRFEDDEATDEGEVLSCLLGVHTGFW